MKKPDISIIVPIYNSEEYLAQTIDSIINQTIKNIEIVLVNDGSTDNSLAVCEEYAEKDKRIIILSKPNGGLADARNYGMNHASGTYFMFIDADDLFEVDSCESMLNEIVKHDADYVIGNYQIMDDDGVKWPAPAFDQEKYTNMVLDINDHEKSFWVMNSTAWNKIYKAEFLHKNDLFFKVPSPAEDAYMSWMCYLKADKAVYLSKVMYYYRNTPNSLSKNCSKKYFDGINRSYRAIYEAIKEVGGLGFYRYIYAKVNAYLLCQMIDSEKVTDNEKIQLLKKFKWFFDLAKELNAYVIHDSLKDVYAYVLEGQYDDALKEMKTLKEYRETIPIDKRKRMSFPTIEDYKKMEKYDDKFEGEE